MKTKNQEGEAVLDSQSEPRDLAHEIGNRIVRFRKERRLSRVDLARALEVTRDRLAKWELGANPPPIGMLLNLAQRLGVSVDELLGGERLTEKRAARKGRDELIRHLVAMRKLLQ